MPGLYHLSVDVGASRISAATARLARDGAISADAVPLGRRNDQVPAVAFIESDGNVLVGDEAQLLGHSAPERLVREFTRSVGDDVPLSVGGMTITAEHVFATSVAAVVDAVSEREGEPPAAVVVTYPTNWGPHRLGLIRSALTGVGLGEAALVPGVLAAALDHDALHPLGAGQTMAVHDMGGTSYHAAVLRKDEDGSLEVLGQPRDIEDLGGVDFDDAVLRHVLRAAGVSISGVDGGPDTQSALRQLRGECVDAKESLSFDAQATIPVLLPGHSTAVRLTRSEFEAMTANLVDRTIDSLDAALESARVEPEQLAAVLLVGGTSRIPRVAQRLSEAFNRPIAMPQDPASAIAIGAARASLALVHRRALPAVVDQHPTAVALTPEAPRALVAAAQPPVASSPWIRVLSLVTLSSVAVAATVLLTSSLTGGFGFLGSAAPAALLGNPSPAPTPSASASADPAAPSSEPAAAPDGAAPAPVDAAPGVPAQITVKQDPPTSSPGLTPRPVSQYVPSTPEDAATTLPRASTPATSRPPLSTPTTPGSQLPPTTNVPTPSTQPPTSTPTTPGPTTPDPTTPAPDPTTPDPTTPAPDPTTPAPDPTTPAPDPTTPAPDPTTPAPDPTTPAPDPTTPEPDPTTQEPAPTSVAPPPDPDPLPTQDPTPEPPPSTTPEPVAV